MEPITELTLASVPDWGKAIDIDAILRRYERAIMRACLDETFFLPQEQRLRRHTGPPVDGPPPSLPQETMHVLS